MLSLPVRRFVKSKAWSVLTAGAMWLSAFLVFILEPLVAKRILPWFGGSAAVWSTCLVFYQTALLVGYFYARLITRYLKPLAQAGLHILLLAPPPRLLPIGPGVDWEPAFNR